MSTETATFNPAFASQSPFVKRIAIITGITIAAAIALFATSAFLASMVWNGLEAGQLAPTLAVATSIVISSV